MEHCTCLNPEALSGVLKTIYLFLEGQNFRETCKTFLSESRGMGFAEVKKAIACLLVLKPTAVEVVSVSHADSVKAALKIQAEIAQEAETDASSKYLHIYYGEPLCIRPLDPTASSPDMNDGPKTCPCKPFCQAAKKTDDADRHNENAAASHMQTASTEDDEVLLRMEDYKGTPSSATMSKRSNISRLKNETSEVASVVPSVVSNRPPSVASSKVQSASPSVPSGTFSPSIFSQPSPKLTTPSPSLVMLQEVEDPCVPVHPTSSVRFDIDGRVLQPIISCHEAKIIRNVEAVPSYPTNVPAGNLISASNYSRPGTPRNPENPIDPGNSCSRILPRSCNPNSYSQNHLCASQSRVCNPVINLDETGPCGEKSPCNTVVPCSEVTPCGHVFDEGETLSPTRMPSKSILAKVSKFGSSIGLQIEDCLRKNVDISTATAQASVLVSVADSSVSTRTLQAQYQLDYGKIKRELRWGCPSVKMMLLQALRWRLTQPNEQRRNEVMSDYARHDLLSLHGSPKNHTILVEDFLCTNSIKLGPQHQEGMARMVNAIASLTLGRDYLCQDEKLLTKIIIPLLMDVHPLKKLLLQSTAEFLWVALQKLSLRNNMRLIMIQAGLVEYLMSYLSQHRNLMSDYCLEYCLALFMNLCLHNEAIVRIKKKARDVIHFVSDFLSNDHNSCLSYINGAMYSLFMEPDIRKEAKHAHLDTKLADKSKSVDEEIRQQMEVILDLLDSNKSAYGCYKCDCIDQCDEIDHLENEIEEGDITSGIPNGETLLNLYRIVTESTEPDIIPLTCMCRPATPSKKISAAEKCPHSYDESSLEVDTKPEHEKKHKSKCFARSKKAKVQEISTENALDCPKTDTVCCPVEDESIPVKESSPSKASIGTKCNAPSCTEVDHTLGVCKKCLKAKQRSTTSVRRSPSSASQLGNVKCKCSKKATSAQREQLPLEPTPQLEPEPELEEQPVVTSRMSNWSTVKQEPTTTNMVMYSSACQQCCPTEIAQYNRQKMFAATAQQAVSQNILTKSARSQQGLTVQTHSQQPLTHQSCSQQGLTQRSCSELTRSCSQLTRQNTVSEIVEVKVDPELNTVIKRSVINVSPSHQQDTVSRSVVVKKSSMARPISQQSYGAWRSGFEPTSGNVTEVEQQVVVTDIATQSEHFTSHVSIQLSEPSIHEPVPCSSQHVECSTAEQPFVESHTSPLMMPIPIMQPIGEEEEAIGATIEESNFESVKNLIDKEESEDHAQSCRPACGAKPRKPRGPKDLGQSRESRTPSKLFDSNRTNYVAPSSSHIRVKTQYRNNGQFAPYNISCDPCRMYQAYNPCCREIPYCYNTNAYYKTPNQCCPCPRESSRMSYRATVSAVSQKNKYSCECYNNVKQFVQSTDVSQCNGQINRSRNENPSEEQRNESEVSTPERELKNLEQALLSDSDNLCEFEMLRGSKVIDCECYSMVFQSRPKLPRTP